MKEEVEQRQTKTLREGNFWTKYVGTVKKKKDKIFPFSMLIVGAKLSANFARRLNLTGTQDNVNGPQNQKEKNLGEIFK